MRPSSPMPRALDHGSFLALESAPVGETSSVFPYRYPLSSLPKAGLPGFEAPYRLLLPAPLRIHGEEIQSSPLQPSPGEMQHLYLVYKSSRRTGDRETWSVGQHFRDKVGNLAGRPMELPGWTAPQPWLSYLSMQRHSFRYPFPPCPCSLLSGLERPSAPRDGSSKAVGLHSPEDAALGMVSDSLLCWEWPS